MGRKITIDDYIRICRKVKVDKVSNAAARDCRPEGEIGEYSQRKVTDALTWFDNLTPREALVFLKDSDLRIIYEIEKGISLAEPLSGEKISQVLSERIRGRIEQIAKCMWVPLPHTVSLNPMLYGEGFFEIEIGGQSLRWKQSQFTLTNAEYWLLSEYLPSLVDEEGKELGALWQESKREMCQYLTALQMHYIALNDGWGEATLRDTEQALFSNPQSVRDDSRFSTAEFLLSQYPLLNAKVSQFKEQLIRSSMCN